MIGSGSPGWIDKPWRPEALRLFRIESGRAHRHYFFRALDAEALAATLGRCARGEAAGGHIAKALHVLSVFATEFGVVIGELAAPPEANEIIAAPPFLKGFVREPCWSALRAKHRMLRIA